MNTTPLGRLRRVGILEGISFVLLLFVAMPLKYLADMPMAVSVVGMAHGVLFIVLCYFLMEVRSEYRWSLIKAGKVLLAALLPFGPFVIDRRLKEEDEATRQDHQG